jgi:RNA polymerase sigma-70 factor (ECF subfamily)
MDEPIRLVAAPPEATELPVELTDLAATDASDFEAFFEREYPRLFGAMSLITHDRAEAEEVTQDAFVTVWERWGRVAGMERPDGYLYRVAMNGYRKRLRRAAFAARRLLGTVPPDDALAEVEAIDAAVRAMTLLSPMQRAAVVLVDLLGFDSREAGRLLGIRASTVRVHVSRGHAALRTTLGEER